MKGIRKQDFLILIRLPVINNIGSDVFTLNKTKSISYNSKIQPYFVHNLQLTVTNRLRVFLYRSPLSI